MRENWISFFRLAQADSYSRDPSWGRSKAFADSLSEKTLASESLLVIKSDLINLTFSSFFFMNETEETINRVSMEVFFSSFLN